MATLRVANIFNILYSLFYILYPIFQRYFKHRNPIPVPAEVGSVSACTA